MKKKQNLLYSEKTFISNLPSIQPSRLNLNISKNNTNFNINQIQSPKQAIQMALIDPNIDTNGYQFSGTKKFGFFKDSQQTRDLVKKNAYALPIKKTKDKFLELRKNQTINLSIHSKNKINVQKNNRSIPSIAKQGKINHKRIQIIKPLQTTHFQRETSNFRKRKYPYMKKIPIQVLSERKLEGISHIIQDQRKLQNNILLIESSFRQNNWELKNKNTTNLRKNKFILPQKIPHKESNQDNFDKVNQQLNQQNQYADPFSQDFMAKPNITNVNQSYDNLFCRTLYLIDHSILNKVDTYLDNSLQKNDRTSTTIQCIYKKYQVCMSSIKNPEINILNSPHKSNILDLQFYDFNFEQEKIKRIAKTPSKRKKIDEI